MPEENEPGRRPTLPENARCEKCGHSRITPLPTYGVGAGVGFKPVADDVLCQRCGHIGPPTMELRSKTKGA